MTLQLEIQNNRTFLCNADPALLSYLDSTLRYSTAITDLNEYRSKDELLNSWDGWVRFLHIPQNLLPWFPTGLLDMVLGVLRTYNYSYHIFDRRVRPEDQVPFFAEIPLRDYQKEAVELGLRMGRGVYNMVPRSGKTRLALELYNRLAHPTLWVAPTNQIVEQTRETIDSFFGKGEALQLTGKALWKEAAKASIVVSTVATACRVPQEFYDTRQMLIVDEMHHCPAKSYGAIFKRCEHVYYRFGLTGTFFRSNGDDMAMHAHLANTIYKVDSDFLVKRGYLVPTKVVFIPVLGEKLKMETGIFNEAHGKHGIHRHVLRNQMVARCAYSLYQSGRTTLILVGTKYQGRLLKDRLISYLKDLPATEFVPVQFVSSETPRPLLKRILESFLARGGVKVLISTSVLGEGADLPSADALVYAVGQKAEVSVVQNVYRVGTASAGKSHAVLVDFADRHHKKLLEHTEDRARIYMKESTFQVSVLDSIEQFESWLGQLRS